MSAHLYLGLDVGTQGTKALLLDADSGRIVGRAAVGYGLIEGLPAGAAEQHPDSWIDAVGTAARAAVKRVDPARVAGVGVSGQQHGCVLLDERRRVLRPAKLWCDTSTAEEARELGVPAGFTASKILWIKRRERQHWERARHVLLPHDYVNFRLTGALTMEAGDASGTGFFDPIRRAFDAYAIEKLDVRLAGMLPPLLPPGVPAGRLSPDGAALLGLRQGLPVAAGGGDNMMSAVGSGATREGVLVVSLGTSGTAFAYSGTPVADRQRLIAPFCDSTGGWLPLLCVMNATGVLEEVRAAFQLGHDELTAAAREVAPGCEGMRFLPYLQGERVPDLPQASGTIVGLQAGSLRPGALYRASIEGCSLNLAWGVQRLKSLGVEVESVRLTGGGARNLLWRQVLADCLDSTVAALAEPESAALGAALCALWTARRLAGEDVSAHEVAAPFIRLDAGLVEPQRPEVYRELLEAFRASVARVYG